MSRSHRRSVPQSAGAHPDEMVAAAWLDGTLGPSLRAEVEGHLAACAECRLTLAALKLDTGDDAGLDETLLRRARRQTLPALTWMRAAAAAVVVLTLGAGAWWLLAPPATSPDPAVFRGHTDGRFHDLAPEPGASISRDALQFAWSAVPGADRYTVLITRPDTTLVIMFVVRPDEIPSGWPPGQPLPEPGPYLWSVRALSVDREIALTRPIPFQLR